jgi:hypothetical protein
MFEPPPATAPEPRRPKRRNWLLRRVDAWSETLRIVRHEPHRAWPLARDAAFALWSSRGGGFYGLGYVVTFIVLEIRTITSGFATSDDVIGFLGLEILQMFFRVAFESLFNTLQAFLWPLFVLELLSNWGIVLLVAGWWAYGRFAVPWVRERFGVAPRPRKPKPRRPKADPEPDTKEETE